jgi:hypothetical protein
MVGVISNDNFDRLYNGYYDEPNAADAGNADFVELHDLVSELEVRGDYDDPVNKDLWRRVHELMKLLEAKYLDS